MAPALERTFEGPTELGLIGSYECLDPRMSSFKQRLTVAILADYPISQMLDIRW
jgi:hypothetical protein